MAAEPVIYEYPCTEKIRVCLRLEESIRRMEYFIEQDNRTAHLSAFRILFDLIELTTRSDLRKDLIQELQRLRAALSSPARPIRIDDEAAAEYLPEIIRTVQGLATPAPASRSPQSLRDSDWLSLIRTRSGMPGGNCCFDLPSLHYWLGRPFEERRGQFLEWLASSHSIRDAVQLILGILRSTAVWRPCQAKAGSARLQVPANTNLGLVQVLMPAESIHIPEVSVNKFMLWIHFLDAAERMRTPPSRSDIEFDIGLCAI